ncbi:SDR family oxidoreductase [Devosia sp.]|uniref:SDR family oxidoreductase n=1 Tax=Devosia sp. TaxID=1871048 RepID=UPI001AC9FAAE|nr:SDR family oxidoreductase [Devosia sp.]MBN9308922.1 SDR family oxidoreductase [Devosia sp.]
MAEQVLVVTGGSRGIGAAVARLAAARGYGVVLNYLGNVAAAEAVCATIHAAGGEAVAVRGDVGREEDIEHIFRAADRMGPLRALVNNAGMIAPVARLDAMEPARIAEILRVNVLGTMLCSAAAVRRMSTRHGGKGGGIVNLSSAAAKLGAPGAYLDYAASKGAIDTFTVGLAVEVAGEGIRVNGVRPGIIDTDFHAQGGEPDRVRRLAPTIPMGRPGTADEVAQTILWLLSEDASYVTGTTLAVTGGRAVVP